ATTPVASYRQSPRQPCRSAPWQVADTSSPKDPTQSGQKCSRFRVWRGAPKGPGRTSRASPLRSARDQSTPLASIRGWTDAEELRVKFWCEYSFRDRHLEICAAVSHGKAGQEVLCVLCGRAASASCSDRLTVCVVDEVASGKHPRQVGTGGRVLDFDVAVAIGRDLINDKF